MWIHSSVGDVITIYLALDIFTFILTGNPSAARVADDFKSWVSAIAAPVLCNTFHQPTFQSQVVRGFFVCLQAPDASQMANSRSTPTGHQAAILSLCWFTYVHNRNWKQDGRDIHNIGPFGGRHRNNSWTLNQLNVEPWTMSVETCQLVSWRTHWNLMSPLILFVPFPDHFSPQGKIGLVNWPDWHHLK